MGGVADDAAYSREVFQIALILFQKRRIHYGKKAFQWKLKGLFSARLLRITSKSRQVTLKRHDRFCITLGADGGNNQPLIGG